MSTAWGTAPCIGCEVSGWLNKRRPCRPGTCEAFGALLFTVALRALKHCGRIALLFIVDVNALVTFLNCAYAVASMATVVLAPVPLPEVVTLGSKLEILPKNPTTVVFKDLAVLLRHATNCVTLSSTVALLDIARVSFDVAACADVEAGVAGEKNVDGVGIPTGGTVGITTPPGTVPKPPLVVVVVTPPFVVVVVVVVVVPKAATCRMSHDGTTVASTLTDTARRASPAGAKRLDEDARWVVMRKIPGREGLSARAVPVVHDDISIKLSRSLVYSEKGFAFYSITHTEVA